MQKSNRTDINGELGTPFDLGRFVDGRGSLIPVEHLDPRIPFPVVRSFLIASVPVCARRAGHALLNCHELLILVQGGVTARLDDGARQVAVRLDRPGRALHVPPETWIELDGFLPGTVLNVLASEPFASISRVDEIGAFRDHIESRGTDGGERR